MDSTSVYLVAKTVHIGAFILAIGVVVCTYFCYGYFWDLYHRDRAQGIAAFRAYNRLQRAGMVSLGVVLLAGAGMLVSADWRLLQMHWFQVKLVLVGVIFLNGYTLGHSATRRLNRFLQASAHDPSEASVVHGKLRNFQLIQLTIYAAIIVVSVFRVN